MCRSGLLDHAGDTNLAVDGSCAGLAAVTLGRRGRGGARAAGRSAAATAPAGVHPLTARLHALLAASVIVRTDDLAWPVPLFAWAACSMTTCCGHFPTGANVDEAERRGLARDIVSETRRRRSAGNRLLARMDARGGQIPRRQQPWRRADVVINGRQGAIPRCPPGRDRQDEGGHRAAGRSTRVGAAPAGRSAALIAVGPERERPHLPLGADARGACDGHDARPSRLHEIARVSIGS